MIFLNLIPVYIAAIMIAAHFSRVGNFAAAGVCIGLPFLLLLRRRWATQVVRLFFVFTAIVWLFTLYDLVSIRLTAELPWLRMALILSAVSAFSILPFFILKRPSLDQKISLSNSHTAASVASFLMTVLLLAIVQYKVKIPMLIAERFIPGLGWGELILLAVYAAWIVEKILDKNTTQIWRQRIWLIFSTVFFAQLLLGLTISEIFLFTGELHLPVPAMIVAGPLYRGHGIFMPILFLSTIILTGPAWCSYLCYIGSWDLAASKKKRKPAPLPGWRHKLRFVSLVCVPAVAIALRIAGASVVTAASAGLLFGIIGIVLMFIWSRQTGAMTHCVSFCPIGLLATWLGKISPFRIKLNDSCTECGACTLACRYDALNIADIQKRSPSLSCTLCGDCFKSCRENSLEYRFLKLKPETARTVFIITVVSLHAAFMGVARI